MVPWFGGDPHQGAERVSDLIRWKASEESMRRLWNGARRPDSNGGYLLQGGVRRWVRVGQAVYSLQEQGGRPAMNPYVSPCPHCLGSRAGHRTKPGPTWLPDLTSRFISLDNPYRLVVSNPASFPPCCFLKPIAFLPRRIPRTTLKTMLAFMTATGIGTILI